MPINNLDYRFAIVIPAYNEEATISDVAQRALKQCKDVIIVDDGSCDKTIAKLDGLPITLIKHNTNSGKAASLWSGFTAAMKRDIDFIITIDGDAQHAPEDIPLIIEESIRHPNNIIIGSRLANKLDIPAKRYYANKIANFWIAWAAGYPISDSQSGFRLYPASLFQNLNISVSIKNSFVFESEIIIKAAQKGIQSRPVPIPAVYAENARPSHFKGVRDITLITIMVAKSLIGRGMYLQGLYRSAVKPILLPSYEKKIDFDGYLMLLLSSLLILASAGLSLVFSWAYVLKAAAITSQKISTIETLLVLGKRLVNEKPDSDFILRLKRAAFICSQNHSSKIFILGGKTRETSISEASIGKAFLIQNNVEQKNIFIEEESRNTLENLQYFFSLIKDKQQEISLTTNRYHLARSLLMAKGFGINAQPCPAEEKFTFSLRNILMTFIESLHLHWYLTGKYWAKLTKNTKMLNRIC